MSLKHPRLLVTSVVAGTLLVAIFATLVIRFGAQLRAEIRQKIVERDAAVLRPVARQQLTEPEGSVASPGSAAARSLRSVLRSARQTEGVLAVAIFNAEGTALDAVPSSLLFAEIPPDDYLQLLSGTSISRYHPQLRLDRYFAGISPDQQTAPVLEVLLPLQARDGNTLVGFSQYYIDARPLAGELAAIDQRVNRQTTATLAIGAGLIALIVAAAYTALSRAQRVLAEHNQQLTRANFELALAAKASALGQITSHLIHGLQGSVAGLHAVVAGRGATEAVTPEWQTAADYTARMQAMIHDTVALLSDTSAPTNYELTGLELTDTIRKRNSASAAEKGVRLIVANEFPATLDSHRGGLLCLVATNLVQNAIEATAPGQAVNVRLTFEAETLVLSVADEGCGIPPEFQSRLFEPGHTSRPSGSGLGLAISRLLARQIGANLTLESSGPAGSLFRLALPMP